MGEFRAVRLIASLTAVAVAGCHVAVQSQPTATKPLEIPATLLPTEITFTQPRQPVEVAVRLKAPVRHSSFVRYVGSSFAPAPMECIYIFDGDLGGSLPMVWSKYLDVRAPEAGRIPTIELEVGAISVDSVLDMSNINNMTQTTHAQLTLTCRLLDKAGTIVDELSSAQRFDCTNAAIADAKAGPNPAKLMTKALDDILPRFFASAKVKAALEAARAARETVAQPPPPVRKASRTFVLIIAVDEYADAAITKLRFAESDARSVYDFYANDKKSPAERDRVHLLLGKDAGQRAVLRAIREQLEEKATAPEDVAILYFAGHGFADAKETYLATSDTTLRELPETSIALSTLQTYWSRIAAGTKVLITDACHSGGLANLRGIGGVTVAPRDEASPFKGTIVLSATGANELSAEDEKAGHGVFTSALVAGLRGDADADADGRVTAAELAAYLGREVPEKARAVGGNQRPATNVPAAAGAVSLTR